MRTLNALLPRLDFQLIDKMCNMLSTALLGTLMRLGLIRVHTATVDATNATRHPRLVHKLTDDRALSCSILRESHILRKAQVIQDRTALDLRRMAEK